MPEPYAHPTSTGGPACPWIALVGVSTPELRLFEEALGLFGTSSPSGHRLKVLRPETPKSGQDPWWDSSGGPEQASSHGRARTAPTAVVLALSDPLGAPAEVLTANGPAQALALAVWERFMREALRNLKGLAVYVTTLSGAASDPAGWGRAMRAFLSARGVSPTIADTELDERLSAVFGRAEPNGNAVKDQGLLLASQRQIAALLDQLVGPHDCFDPPLPEPESAWVAALLEARRDLAQLWQGLDWSTEQLASFLPNRARAAVGSEAYPPNASEDLEAYHHWLERRGEAPVLPLSGGLPLARARVRAKRPPLFSVVVPVLRPPLWALERCVASVLAQSYREFQLVLVDDASGDAQLSEQLRGFTRLDARVEAVQRTETGGISKATNAAIGRARGEYVVFLDHDDELHPEALAKMAAAITANPDADVLYSDEDKLNASGERCVPSLKPDWSPDLLLSSAYFCHMLVVRRSLLSELGGLRPEFDGSQDYDLMLRATEVARAVVHVPEILYHWRVLAGSTSADPHAKPWAFEAERRALEQALARREIVGTVEAHSRFAGNFHLRRSVVGEPLVSIIVPFHDEPEMTASCYRSLVSEPGYDRYELLLVDNSSELPETKVLAAELTKDPRVRLLEDPRPFDWVAINNAAAAEARGDVLLFLNNDIEARSPGWLAAMLGHAQREEVGAVGALLRYPDLTVQHAGIVIGMSFGAAHVQQGLPFDSPGYMLMAELTRDCSAVTGACMMTRRSCFEDLGGFDPALPVAFNDVDYCLRLRAKGLLVVYTPLAELIHFESTSRGHADDVVETPLFRNRWSKAILGGDPYYNLNLTHFDPYCRLSTEE
ncbi:MAG: glycosyltransferase, partial [Acidimicrobiales bacterium]